MSKLRVEIDLNAVVNRGMEVTFALSLVQEDLLVKHGLIELEPGDAGEVTDKAGEYVGRWQVAA